MKKIGLVLVCLVILTVLAGCQKGDMIDFLSSNYEVFDYRLLSDEIPDVPKCDKVWTPKGFMGFGQLQQKWVNEIDYGDRWEGISDVDVYPDSWGQLDPETGKYLGSPSQQANGSIVDGVIDEFSFSQGFTDEKYKIEKTYGGHMSTIAMVVKDYETNEILWRKSIGTDFESLVVSNSLIFIKTDLGGGYIARLNPETGEEIWSLNLQIFQSIDAQIFDDKIVFVLGAPNLDKTIICLIDPETGSYMEKEVSFSNIESFICLDNKIWLFDACSNYCIFDMHDESILTGDLGFETDFMLANDKHERIKVIDNLLLIKLLKPDEYDSYYMLFDTKSKKREFLEYEYVDVVNGALVACNEETIFELSPDSLSRIWWVKRTDEMDFNPNPQYYDSKPSVLWCDDRGVLIVGGGKLFCYDQEDSLSKVISQNENGLVATFPEGWSFSSDSDEIDDKIIRLQEIVPNSEKLEIYVPEKFDGEGVLSKKWEIDLGTGKHFVEDMFGSQKFDFLALNDTWCFKKDYLDKEGDWESRKELSFAINPETGDYKETQTRYGITDGKTVWVDDYCGGCLERTLCWKPDVGDIWVGKEFDEGEGLFNRDDFYIVSGKLLFVGKKTWNGLRSEKISLMDPWTGKREWEFSTSNEILRVFSLPLSNSILLETGYAENIGIGEHTYIYEYFVLDINNLIMKKVFDGENFFVFKVDDDVFAMTNGELFRFSNDFEKLEKITDYDQDFRPITDRRKFWNNAAGTYILVESWKNQTLPPELMNTETGEKKPLGFSSQMIINGCLVASDGRRLFSLNPENLNPVWKIECDNLGKNPEVIWQDERGVLIMSDSKLTCFGGN